MASVTKYAQNLVGMMYGNGTVYGSGWHTRPGMYAGGNVTFTRDNNNSVISYSGTIQTTMSVDAINPYYEFAITAELHLNNDPDGAAIASWNFGVPYSSTSTKSINISGSFTMTNNSTPIIIYYYCNYNNIRGGCEATPQTAPHTLVFEMNSSELPYNPYTPGSITINSITPTIGSVGSTTFKIKYTTVKGSNNIDGTYGKIYEGDSSSQVCPELVFGRTSPGTYEEAFTLSSSYFSGGKLYKMLAQMNERRYSEDRYYTHLNYPSTHIQYLLYQVLQ